MKRVFMSSDKSVTRTIIWLQWRWWVFDGFKHKTWNVKEMKRLGVVLLSTVMVLVILRVKLREPCKETWDKIWCLFFAFGHAGILGVLTRVSRKELLCMHAEYLDGCSGCTWNSMCTVTFNQASVDNVVLWFSKERKPIRNCSCTPPKLSLHCQNRASWTVEFATLNYDDTPQFELTLCSRIIEVLISCLYTTKTCDTVLLACHLVRISKSHVGLAAKQLNESTTKFLRSSRSGTLTRPAVFQRRARNAVTTYELARLLWERRVSRNRNGNGPVASPSQRARSRQKRNACENKWPIWKWKLNCKDNFRIRFHLPIRINNHELLKAITVHSACAQLF